MRETLTFDQLPAAVSQINEKLTNIEKLLLHRKEQHPLEQPEQLLTVQEAAKFLNLSIPTIYSKVSRGELPVMKRTKRLYFSQIELLKYVQAGRRMSNTEISAKADNYLKEKERG